MRSPNFIEAAFDQKARWLLLPRAEPRVAKPLLRVGEGLPHRFRRNELKARILDESQRSRGLPATPTLKRDGELVSRPALLNQPPEIVGRADRFLRDGDDQIVALDPGIVPW